ncbi:MAG: SMI1/KNR4 family protein [Cyanobacteria bacterium SZAS-4]|nr:SMI1/KNR4 family protein [Cyanobacteria bacterium SZAS-4]
MLIIAIHTASIEKEHGVLLPNSYKTFLRLIGQDAGDFLVDNHSDAFFRHLSTLGTKTDFSDILEVLSEKNKALTEIPEKAFVFLERLGAFYMYFVADGSSDDPPIFAITERDGIVGPVYENFWEFIQVSVEDFEFHTDPRNFS